MPFAWLSGRMMLQRSVHRACLGAWMDFRGKMVFFRININFSAESVHVTFGVDCSSSMRCRRRMRSRTKFMILSRWLNYTNLLQWCKSWSRLHWAESTSSISVIFFFEMDRKILLEQRLEKSKRQWGTEEASLKLCSSEQIRVLFMFRLLDSELAQRNKPHQLFLLAGNKLNCPSRFSSSYTTQHHTRRSLTRQYYPKALLITSL